jgi:RHS repeat-associated protein
LQGVYYTDGTSVEYQYDAFRRKVARTQTYYDMDKVGKGLGVGQGKGRDQSQGRGHSDKGIQNAMNRGDGEKKGLIDQLLSTETTQYLYDGMNVFKECGENTQPLAQYYYADGQVLAKKMFGLHGRKSDSYLGNLQTKGGLLYYQQDALGNVMDVTDRTGDIIQSYRYDVFGNLFTQMAAPYNTIGFTGKTYDAKASLMDFSARWYSPNVGRFTTADTFLGWMDQPQSLNRYSYVHNNPVNFIDPTGRFIQENERICDCEGYVEPEPTPSPSPGTGGSGDDYTGGAPSDGDLVYSPPTLTSEQIFAQRMYDFNLLAGDDYSSSTNTLLSNFSYAGYGFNTLVASNGVSNNQQEPLGAESPEVFKINMQLNQLKMDWE